MSSAMTPTLPTAMLRPVLEAAVQVARAGESADPVQPGPPALRRYLRFAKLPVPALDIARRVARAAQRGRQAVERGRGGTGATDRGSSARAARDPHAPSRTRAGRAPAAAVGRF